MFSSPLTLSSFLVNLNNPLLGKFCPTHQVFSPEDDHCSGDLRLEMVMFPRAAEGDRDGGMCAVGHFEDGSTKYYR